MDFPSAHSRKEGPAETLNPEFPWSLDAFITTDAIALSLSLYIQKALDVDSNPKLFSEPLLLRLRV